MSLLYRRIATFAFLALFLMSSTMALYPATEVTGSEDGTFGSHLQQSLSDSSRNFTVPYADKHYGAADGIIDPYEYASNYTDEASGITVYLEHNGTVLYVAMTATTSGWIGMAWQNYTDSFRTAGLNNSDIIYGYAPGTPYDTVWRAQGTDIVTVHYILSLRNGTVIQENDYPSLDSTEQLDKLGALPMYKEMIYGMRLGEVRHFVIPANRAYTEPDHHLYGQDLEYEITLTRITREDNTKTENSAVHSEIVYSDQYGVSTIQHLEDGDQDRISSANATDTGDLTTVEYAILLNSTDAEDISFLVDSNVMYPVVFMQGLTEDIDEIPIQRTYWTDPAMLILVPNEGPVIVPHNPTQGSVLTWAETFQVEAFDSYVRTVQYKIDDENWTHMSWNFLTGFWEKRLDLRNYENGDYVVSFNATDPSNMSSVLDVDVSIYRPYIPLLGAELSVDREIVTEVYHRAYVSDIYTLRNNGSVPLSAIEIYLPARWIPNFLRIYAHHSSGDEIKVTTLPTVKGMLHWRIHFNKQVGYDEEYIFSTVMQMHSLNTLTDVPTKKYRLTFLKYPVVPHILSEAAFKLTYRSSDSPAGGADPPSETTSNLAPMNEELFSASFTSFNPILTADRKTVIRADPWGWMAYKDTITVYNIGVNPELNLIFQFPTYSAGIKIFDEVGLLAESMTSFQGEWNTSRYVDIKLQSDRFGEEGLEPGFQYTFTVEYVVQISSHETPASGGTLLEVPMGELDEMLTNHHIVDVVLPLSFNTIEASGGYRLLYGVFDTTLRYQAYNITEYNPLDINILYQISPAVGVRPIAFSLIIGLFALAYIAYRLVELPESVSVEDDDDHVATERRQVGAPPELLREFANLYSKKTALDMDLEKLESARRRGKIKKREFMIRERDMKAQLEEIDSKLPGIKEELATYGAKYRDMVGQLELQNEKIEGAKAGLRQLLLRKKKQRISRVAFEKSRQDYLKTIQKATSAIDRTLLTIQEEAGDI